MAPRVFIGAVGFSLSQHRNEKPMRKQRIDFSAATRTHPIPSIRLYDKVGRWPAPHKVTPAAVTDYMLAFNKFNKTGDIEVFEDVGLNGINSKMFAEDLRSLGRVDEISIYINSPGGSVFDGLTIYSLLQRHPAKITAHVVGLAASIASVIAMAADTIEISPQGKIMIHDAWGAGMGEAADLRKLADTLDRVTASIAEIYTERTGNPGAKVRAMMRAETWMDAEDALSMGFADSIFRPHHKADARAVAHRLEQLAVEQITDRHTPAAVAARLREISKY